MTNLGRIVCGLLGLLLSLQCAPSVAAEELISTAELREDLNSIRAVISEKHPYFQHTAIPREVDRQLKRIDRKLDRPMSQIEAWAVFATLNPYLADAHFFVGLPKWREATTILVANGNGLFPFEVELSPSGKLRILSALGGERSPYEGLIVRSINGKKSKFIA